MFKNLFVISLFCLTFSITSLALANSEINLGGPGDSLEMHIVQDMQREVVSYEPYESTCYREVSNGTRTECSTRSENRCTKKPLECHDEPIEVCSEVEDTTTESYSCTKYEKVVSYEYDYTVSAQVSVLKNENSKEFDLSKCTFGVELNETAEEFYAKCENAIVRAKVTERVENLNGRNKERKIKLELDFQNIEGLNALKKGMGQLNFSNNEFNFISANLAEANNFKLNLKLIKNRFLLKDVTLIDQEIKNSAMKIKEQGNGSFKISINLKSLASKFDPTKKSTLTLSLRTLKNVDVSGSINRPTLINELRDTLIINDKK